MSTSIRRMMAIGLFAATLTAPVAAEPLAQQDQPAPPAIHKTIEQLTGARGVWSEQEHVFKVSVPRTDLRVKVAGVKLTPPMGLTTWAAFAGSDQQAVVDGDFAMLESELQPVLKALRGAGINIVAIHNHMTGESPRIIFLHFWGVGRSDALATGIRAALDQTKGS